MQIENPYLWITLATLGVVVACVLFHYEGLRALSRWVTADVLPARARIVSLIFGQLVLHVSEIWLFGLTYYVLAERNGFGSIIAKMAQSHSGPATSMSLIDFIYYSATVYSTLGFGDLIATGPLRLLTGVEAVTGLVLITWSASFTFLEMQRYWGRG